MKLTQSMSGLMQDTNQESERPSQQIASKHMGSQSMADFNNIDINQIGSSQVSGKS
jgi:hypothetical protein